MHTALAFLSMIDPEAFEIAFQAVVGRAWEPEAIDTGHEPRVEWYLPEEIPDDFWDLPAGGREEDTMSITERDGIRWSTYRYAAPNADSAPSVCRTALPAGAGISP
jgi:hypothetical protein